MSLSSAPLVSLNPMIKKSFKISGFLLIDKSTVLKTLRFQILENHKLLKTSIYVTIQNLRYLKISSSVIYFVFDSCQAQH